MFFFNFGYEGYSRYFLQLVCVVCFFLCIVIVYVCRFNLFVGPLVLACLLMNFMS